MITLHICTIQTWPLARPPNTCGWDVHILLSIQCKMSDISCNILRRGHDNVMFIGVSCQGGVVGLDVQFKVPLQTVMFQESYNTHGVYNKKKNSAALKLSNAETDCEAEVDVTPHRNHTGVCRAPLAWAQSETDTSAQSSLCTLKTNTAKSVTS